MMHFSPVSDFPLFSKKFQILRKIFKMLPFLEKFLAFHPPKFVMTFFLFFLVIDYKFRISPLFSLFQYISPLFPENYYFPYFDKFSPLFYTNSPAFNLLYVYFVSPYLYHDAFMHHPMHVLDACAY